MNLKSNSRGEDSKPQKIINFVVVSALGIVLLYFWLNNHQKVGYDDLMRIEGELTNFEYKKSQGGTRPSYALFFKIKGYDCEFYRAVNYDMFKRTLNDSVDLIVTYIEPREKKRLDEGKQSIQILGLQVNSEPILGIDSAIKQRNFMNSYGTLLLGVVMCIWGFFEFKSFLRLRRENNENNCT